MYSLFPRYTHYPGTGSDTNDKKNINKYAGSSTFQMYFSQSTSWREVLSEGWNKMTSVENALRVFHFILVSLEPTYSSLRHIFTTVCVI